MKQMKKKKSVARKRMNWTAIYHSSSFAVDTNDAVKIHTHTLVFRSFVPFRHYRNLWH